MAVEQLLPTILEDLEASRITVTEDHIEVKDFLEDENKEVVEVQCLDKVPLLNTSENNVDEKCDSTPENPDKICEPEDSDADSDSDSDSDNLQLQVSKLLTPKSPTQLALQISLQKIDENEELDTATDNTDAGYSVNGLSPTGQTSPTAEEVSRFINDKSAYIEDVFKCMLRGISNSKLSMVKNGFNAPSSITELEDGDEEGDGVVLSDSSTTCDVINPEVKIVKLIRNLDYFIDIVCSIKSSDAKDTYSIIVLYEKLIFDLKAEISSLTKSLKIYQTIVGKKQEATR